MTRTGGADAVLALNQTPGRPLDVAARIAARYNPRVAASFMRALARLDNAIDMGILQAAVASGNSAAIAAAIGPSRLGALLAGGDSLTELLQSTSLDTGTAMAELLEIETAIPFQFNRVDPNAVMFARDRSADLVVAVSDDVRTAIRIVNATGQLQGLTTRQQAVAIRQVVGLPPNWASAPGNLGNELRNGTFTESRRLSAVDKAMIRKRLAEGTVDEPFIQEMTGRYSDSLKNRRALNIARTETSFASMHGQRVAWDQARDQNVIPATSRRVFIVTPDDRLRETHARVPAMNPDGVPLEGYFKTPIGPKKGPPIEPNCRCSEGLIFPPPGGTFTDDIVPTPGTPPAGRNQPPSAMEAAVHLENKQRQGQRLVDKMTTEIRALNDEADRLIRAGQGTESLELLDRSATLFTRRVRVQRVMEEIGMRYIRQNSPNATNFSVRVGTAHQVNGVVRDRIQEGIDGFIDLVHAKYLDNLTVRGGKAVERLKLFSTRDARGYFNCERESAYVHKWTRSKTVVHELTHGLEHFNDDVSNAARAFFDRRTAGLTSRRLNEIVPGSGYKNWEVAIEDDFLDPYMGKLYPVRDYSGKAATEVVTMGMERMFTDPLAFAKEDFDHFTFIWKIVTGTL